MKPSTYILTLLMKGYAKNNEFDKAQQLLQRMLDSDYFLPNKVTYNTFIQCALQC